MSMRQIIFIIMVIVCGSTILISLDSLFFNLGLKKIVKDRDEKVDIDVNIFELEQDDPRLIQYIREKYLEEPPQHPRNIDQNKQYKDYSQFEQQPTVIKLLGGQREGFFVDCGAYDGIFLSNTIYMEEKLGWTGLLIEAGSKNYQSLKNHMRNSWTLNACLNTAKKTEKVIFFESDMIGGIELSDHFLEKPRPISKVEVMCFPFFSVLSAVGHTEIDYFSLDIEGAELQVLQTIPWDLVKIKVLTLEYKHIPEGVQAVWDFMYSKGYRCYKNLKKHDFVLYHPSYMTEEQLRMIREEEKEALESGMGIDKQDKYCLLHA